MKKMFKSAVAVMLAVILVFGGAPAGALAGLDLSWPDWLKSPLSFNASAAGDVWDGSVASGFASGSGTEADPYIIETAAQLAYLASSVNGGTTYEGKFIKLANDIVLNSSDVFVYDGDGNITGKAEGKTPNTWIAIGTSSSTFRGELDGSGYTVSGIYIDTTLNYQGLFGYTGYHGTIKNVGIADSYIKGNDSVGGVAGSGTVSNSYNTGSVMGSNRVGGVAGSGTVSDCYNSGIVMGSDYVGGVAGSGTVSNSYNTGSVTGTSNVGGVAGYKDGGTVSNSYNTGSVTGSGDYVGGVVGYNNYSGTVSNSYNTGSVSGLGNNVGGVVGYNHGYGTARNSYNAGSVTGLYSCIGGVVGYDDDYGTASNCYYLSGTAAGGINGRDISGDAKALTYSQMQLQTSFVNWDFETIWTMKGNPEYPYPEIEALYHMGEIPEYVAVDSVTLTPKSLSIFIGETARLTVTVTPSDATDASVTWSSSNSNVAMVGANGLVTAKNSGTATITATANGTTNGIISDTCEVTVTPVTLSSVEIKSLPATTSYFVGDTLDTAGLTLTATYSNGTTQTITGGFTCSPTSLNTAGTQMIIVNYDGKIRTFNVTVSKINASGFIIEAIPDKPFTGGAITPTVVVKFNGMTLTPNTDYTVSYTNNTNAGIATVTITGIGNYTGTKTATFEIVTVPLEGITLSSTALSLRYKGTSKLTVTFNPTEATNKNVTWTSSNEKVATVDANGNVTAKGTGTATITATAEDGGKTASCTVTVKLVWWQWLIKIMLFGWIWY